MHVRFREFTFDSETRQLVHGDREVHLSPKAFALLHTLLEHRPRVVDKDELHARIWPGAFVVDANLNVLVAELRRALGDSRQSPRYIRTVHGIGYAFCANATDVDVAPRRLAATSPRFWLLWNERTLVLSEGDNIIGRDPDCDVWVDASGVSRRHARVRVPAKTNDVILEDLGSKNGTFVQSVPVESTASLKDGDVIQIGSVALRFRANKASETERVSPAHR